MRVHLEVKHLPGTVLPQKRPAPLPAPPPPTEFELANAKLASEGHRTLQAEHRVKAEDAAKDAAIHAAIPHGAPDHDEAQQLAETLTAAAERHAKIAATHGLHAARYDAVLALAPKAP